jgi:hypothetical protein
MQLKVVRFTVLLDIDSSYLRTWKESISPPADSLPSNIDPKPSLTMLVID